MVTMIIAFTFAMASDGLDPYASKWDAWVSRMGHVVMFVGAFMALLLLIIDISGERSESQTVFEAVLVFVRMCMALTEFGEAFAIACSVRVERQGDHFPRFRRMKWIRGKRGSTIGEGEDTTISSSGRSPKQPLPGMRLHDPLHGRQACPKLIAFDQGVGQMCPR